MKTATNRSKPVIGSTVTKELLKCLREMRRDNVRFNQPDAVESRGYMVHDAEEIDLWEDIIRSMAKDWREIQRNAVLLDPDTALALDLATVTARTARTDYGKQCRQAFALRAIKAVSSAYIDAEEKGKGIEDLAVEIREMTPEEKFAEWLTMHNQPEAA